MTYSIPQHQRRVVNLRSPYEIDWFYLNVFPLPVLVRLTYLFLVGGTRDAQRWCPFTPSPFITYIRNPCFKSIQPWSNTDRIMFLYLFENFSSRGCVQKIHIHQPHCMSPLPSQPISATQFILSHVVGRSEPLDLVFCDVRPARTAMHWGDYQSQNILHKKKSSRNLHRGI